MKRILINDTAIECFDSIKELPSNRHNAYQAYLMQDAGIGSTMADYEKHLLNLMNLLSHGLISEAKTECGNLYANGYAVINRISYKGLALACLIHSVNGKVQTDFSESGIKLTLLELEKSGITVQQISDALEDVKKKLSSELVRYFPKWFGNESQANLNALLVKRFMLECDLLINESPELLQQLKAVDKQITENSLPQAFLPMENQIGAAELFEKEYQHLCSQIETNNFQRPQYLTVFELYSKIEFLNSKKAATTTNE